MFILFWLRDTEKNNLRRAERHHKVGQKHYQDGDHDKAKLHYEIANQYRQKAMKQKGEK